MTIFSELVIKNSSVKKKKEITQVFAFMERVHLPHAQVLIPEKRTFHFKVYLNSNEKSTV